MSFFTMILSYRSGVLPRQARCLWFHSVRWRVHHYADVFQNQLLLEDGLQYNRVMYESTISDFKERKKYLAKDFENRMRRQLCYRNFVVFINRGHPIGHGNRVVTTICVVTEIRRQYPNPNGQYIGFIESLNNT